MFKLTKLDKFFYSAKYYGSNIIIKNYLNLKNNFLPITIPHGVDFFFHEKLVIDLQANEPIYCCFRDDIYESARKIKVAIKFPHPWLFLIKNKKKNQKNSSGSLFVLPPPSYDIFDKIYKKIILGNYPKPWGVLLKERGLLSQHKNWWIKKNFLVHSAGTMNDSNFYYKLLNVLNIYSKIILPNMSSVGIFAASINKDIRVLPNLTIKIIDTEKVVIPQVDSVNYIKTQKVWKNLLSKKPGIAKKQALFLLGYKYLKKSLKIELLKNINKIKNKPFFFKRSYPSFIYKILIFFLYLSIPIHKIIDKNFKDLLDKFLLIIKRKRVMVNQISYFGYFKIKGKFIKPKINFYNMNELRNISPGESLEFK
jgi:hypothetical protein